MRIQIARGDGDTQTEERRKQQESVANWCSQALNALEATAYTRHAVDAIRTKSRAMPGDAEWERTTQIDALHRVRNVLASFRTPFPQHIIESGVENFDGWFEQHRQHFDLFYARYWSFRQQMVPAFIYAGVVILAAIGGAGVLWPLWFLPTVNLWSEFALLGIFAVGIATLLGFLWAVIDWVQSLGRDF